MSKKQFVVISLGLAIFLVTPFLKAQTKLEKDGYEWKLLVDDKPFEIKGVTFGYDKDPAQFESYFRELKSLGVNTIRLWASNENTPKLLDAAQAHGIKVMLGIWMRHGRPGMEDDDRFDYLGETEGKEAMYQNAINKVEQYKNHPAMLSWGVGNEVYLNIETDEEKVVYSQLLERICSQIKKNDPNHPIISVDAWTFGLDWWQEYVPSIDILGINSYGGAAKYIAEEIGQRGIDKPYILTEFGITGEWDIKAMKNGVVFEPSDQNKFDVIVQGYQDWIKNEVKCLGVYVFHYADGNEFLAPWLLTHVNGLKRPQYWAIREAFTGQKPNNYVPKINRFSLPDSEITSGTWVPVKLDVSDQENEKLEVSFYYNQRTGTRRRRNQINKLAIRGNLESGFEIQLPKEHGGIKIYVYVKDSFDNLGIESTSILVYDEEAKQKKYLVPKVELPFYVYKDGEVNPYFASGYMGNYEKITVDLENKEDVKVGKSSMKIAYKAFDNWYGLAFVDPANDWGDIAGGYDISGAKTFSFWAKASKKNVEVKIGFGMITDDKPFPDTAIKTIDVKLKTSWKKYEIKLKDLDLSCIRSGLVLYSSSIGLPQDIFIDDVVFE